MSKTIFVVAIAGIISVSIGCWNSPERGEIESRDVVAPAEDDYNILARLDSLVEQARYAPALSGFEAAKTVYELQNDRTGFIRASIGHGRTLGKMGQYQEAREELERAVGEFELIGVPNVRLESALLGELGRIFVRQGEYDRAEINLKKALTIAQSLEHYDPFLEGRTLQALGLLSHFKGDYDIALDLYELSFESYTRSIGAPYLATVPLNNIANILYRKGDYERALNMHQQVLKSRRNLLRSDHPDIAASLGNLGVLLHARGNYQRALTYHREAIDIWRSNFGEIHPELAASYHNVGESLVALGKYEYAIEMLELSTSIKESLLGTNHPRTATSYATLGEARLKAGDLEGAESMLHLATDVWEAHSLQSLPQYWAALRQRGVLYMRLGQIDKSRKLLNQARLLIGNATHPVSAAVLNDLSELVDEGSYSVEKLELLNAAVGANVPQYTESRPDVNPSVRIVRDDYELLRTLELKAATWYSLSSTPERKFELLHKTLQTLLRASELVTQMRKEMVHSNEPEALVARATALFETAIQVSLDLYRLTSQQRYLEHALHFADRRKTIHFQDVFKSPKPSNFDSANPDLDNEKMLSILISRQERAISEQKFRPQKISAKRDYLTSNLFELRRSYERALQAIEDDHPEFNSVQDVTRTVAVSEIQSTVLDDRSVLLEYFLRSDSLWIFTIDQTSIGTTTVARPPNLEQLVDSLRMGITQGYAEWYLKYATQLHDLLLAPVYPLVGDKDLIIIPEGVLNHVPFEALLTEKTTVPFNRIRFSKLPYVLRDRAISYGYSSTLLYHTKTRSRTATTKDFFGIAPVFDENLRLDSNARQFLSINGYDTTATGNLVSYLPGSGEEVQQIYSLFASTAGRFGQYLYDKSLVLLEDNASENALKEVGVEDFRYVHFATHSFANESDSKLSGLLLTPDKDSGREDGILHAGETYSLNLNAELVVLSACETGIGTLAEGEGIMGLSRGFLSAGAKNLVVSLWPSDDVGTKYLMIEFYRHMLQGQPIREALRTAKLELIELDDVIAKPYFWAPFVHVGS